MNGRGDEDEDATLRAVPKEHEDVVDDDDDVPADACAISRFAAADAEDLISKMGVYNLTIPCV